MANQIQLTQQQIQNILNENLDENFWLFQLGAGSHEEIKNTDNDFSFPFYEKGKELWGKYKPLLHETICNKHKNDINAEIDEMILGNGRELIVIIITELIKFHSLTFSICIPLVAIVLRRGLKSFCKEL